MSQEETLIKSSINLPDPHSLYCSEHKKLKKFYLRDKQIFMCEYDGYETFKNYCHFKDILTENKEEILKLKEAKIVEKDLDYTKTTNSLKDSIECIHKNSSSYNKFIENFNETFIQKIIELNSISLELKAVKDILGNINFRENGSLNFINIGENLEKEHKVLELAYILSKRKIFEFKENENFAEIFLKNVRTLQNLLLNLTKISRNFLENSIEDVHKNFKLEENKNSNYTFDKKEFSRKIFFEEEFELELAEKNNLIQNLKTEISNLTINLKEKNQNINQHNCNLQEKSEYVNQLQISFNNLQISLKKKTENCNSLLTENIDLKEKLKNENKNYEKLTINYKNSNEEKARNTQNYKRQIDDFIKMKKKIEGELDEENSKRKILLQELENLKKENVSLKEKLNLSANEFNNKNAEWNIIRIRFDENKKISENENKKFNLKIEELEKHNKNLLDKNEENKNNFNSTLKSERNKYEELLTEFNKQLAELKKLKDSNDDLVCSSNSAEGEINSIRNKYEEIIGKIQRENLGLKLDKENLNNEYENLTKTITNLQTENLILKNDLENLKSKLKNLEEILRFSKIDVKNKDLEIENKLIEIRSLINSLADSKSNLIKTESELNIKIEELNHINLKNEKKIDEILQENKSLTQKNEICSEEIKKLNELNKVLTGEKEILSENEIQQLEENDSLLYELESLRKNHSDLLIELKALIKQNEIMTAKLEEAEFKFKSENNFTEEINIFQISSNSQMNSHIASILSDKEIAEAELITTKNKLLLKNSEINSLITKYESSQNEVNSLNVKVKLISNLQEKLMIANNRNDELNSLIRILEGQISAKNSDIIQMKSELGTIKLKNEEMNNMLIKHKENLNNLQTYECKIEALEITKSEIEKLKTKVNEAEEFNSTIRSSNINNRSMRSFRRSKSRTSKSILSNIQIRNDIELNQSNENFVMSSANNFNGNVIHDDKYDNIEPGSNIKLNFFSEKNDNDNENADFLKEQIVQSVESVPVEMLINEENLNKVSSWVCENLKTNQIKLNLLFKATFDGFSAMDFKRKCANIKNTIVVARTNFGKIIGGFSPIPWRDPEDEGFAYEEDLTNTTFLFSLSLGEKYNLIISEYAICNTNNLGPVFGGGSDFEIVDYCNEKTNNFYEIGHSFDYTGQREDFYGDLQYLIEDYEVYEVEIQ